ncbi:MAG: VWA domain-containing protein [Hymenobacter sp.]
MAPPRRRAAFLRRRQVPVNEKIPFFGELLFWFFLILAAGSAILALARPQAVTSLVRTAGIDIVILQDGSASMHVTDVKGDRWQRSMQFLRTFGEALRWENDRIALALFAHMATPQIRLTKDPNTYFSFSITSKGSRRSGSRTTAPGTPTSSAASTGVCD